MHAVHLLVCERQIEVALKFEKVDFGVLGIFFGDEVDENEMTLFIIVNSFLEQIFDFFFLFFIFGFFRLRPLVILSNCLVTLVFHYFNPVYLFFIGFVVNVYFSLVVSRTSHRLMYHLFLLLTVVFIKSFFQFLLSINILLNLIPLIVRICHISFFSFLIFPNI